MEVWPGYATAIHPFDDSVMLIADLCHKILHKHTVLDYLYDLYKNTRGDFHTTATRKLVGEIVLTRYNNKTYRIDDIDWDKNPNSTFLQRDGTEITFKDYYTKVC